MPSLHETDASRAKAPHADFKSCQLFLVGDWGQRGRSGNRDACVVDSEADLLRGYAESPKHSVWVAHTASWFPALASSAVRGTSDRRLLVLRSLQEVAHQVLTTWFRYVVVAKDGISILKASELLEVLTAPNRDELFIGCAYDHAGKVVILYRGSVEPLIVPVSWFREGHSGGSRSPGRADLENLAVTDYGQTVRLGNYEIAADAILYEFDEEYRRKARKRAVAADNSLGGSIRRLRLQKGLTQSDFGVPLKTIARIELGEVQKPQVATLRRIAKRLGVSMESLGTY